MKLIWEDWPQDIKIELPPSLFFAMEGMLKTEDEVKECLLDCLLLYNGVERKVSDSSYINLILDWFEEGLYNDNWSNLEKYAEKVKHMREGPDLKVGAIYKKNFSK